MKTPYLTLIAEGACLFAFFALLMLWLVAAG